MSGPLFLVYWRSAPHCSWCVKAKNLLTARGIPFQAVDIADPAEKALAFERLKKEGWQSVPAIFELTPEGALGKFIGGFEKLEAELQNRL